MQDEKPVVEDNMFFDDAGSLCKVVITEKRSGSDARDERAARDVIYCHTGRMLRG